MLLICKFVFASGMSRTKSDINTCIANIKLYVYLSWKLEPVTIQHYDWIQ